MYLQRQTFRATGTFCDCLLVADVILNLFQDLNQIISMIYLIVFVSL